MLQIDNEMVGVTFAWKKQDAHLRVGGMQRVDGHNVAVPVELDETGYRWLVIVVEQLYQSLVAYLTDVETRIKAGTAVLDRKALWPKKGPIRGPAAEEWRTFLEGRTVHVKGKEQP